MPRYAILLQDSITGDVYQSEESKNVCLSWMRSRSQWEGIEWEEETPLAILCNTVGKERNRWVRFLRQIPEVEPYLIFHEDWQVIPLQWSWQEALWAYSAVRPIWEEPGNVVHAFKLLEMGYSARNAWILGMSYGSDGYRRCINTGHNCIQNREVPHNYPAAIRRGLRSIREAAFPMARVLDGSNQIEMNSQGSVYNTMRLGGTSDFPDQFKAKIGGSLSPELEVFLNE